MPYTFKGCINLILGGMYSMKSTELILRYYRYTYGGKKCLVVKYRGDKRYSEDDTKIVTHSGISLDALPVKFLYEVDDLVPKFDVVCIDEIQFYKDAPYFCDKWANEGKIVEACGLNGKFDRSTFDVISKLIALATDITFKKAVCKQTGNDAIYSQRTVESDEEILIGGADKYRAADRITYFEDINKFIKCEKNNFIGFVNMCIKDEKNPIKITDSEINDACTTLESLIRQNTHVSYPTLLRKYVKNF